MAFWHIDATHIDATHIDATHIDTLGRHHEPISTQSQHHPH
ncbi:hypothetical protein WDM69_00405 [Moraxella lincolnii]